jgi:phage anti-repressor protein
MNTSNVQPLHCLDGAAETENTPIGDLIAIEERRIGGEDRAVSARRLRAALGVKRDFTAWIKSQLKRAKLVEGEDYIRILLTQKGEQTGSGGHNRADYLLTLDAAKHVALMSGTTRGREVRAYFISVEKKARATRTHVGVAAAEKLGRLERDRELIERAGSEAGRALGSLSRKRRANDAAAAPLLAIVQPDLIGIDGEQQHG